LRNYRTLRKLRSFEDSSEDIIWALKGVSIEIREGEVLGLIGRNGAGKSTLLKIMSKITPPTSGQIRIRGRLSSLLEVGTGFHPELTGRENVYLNGTVLGMNKREVDNKFDEIVDYSGVERFIDTPVKRYSSGMKVRLAFAVAAHLEPEILLIDEVLAVGDAEFQRKCLGKMSEVAQSGRTVVFVSHNMQAVQRLCARACLLDDGVVVSEGRPTDVVKAYLAQTTSARHATNLNLGSLLTIHDLHVEQGCSAAERVDSAKPAAVRIAYSLREPTENLLLGFDLATSEGLHLFRTYDMQAVGLGKRSPGSYESVCLVPAGVLPPGVYYIELLVGVHRQGWLTKGDVRIRIDVGGLRTSDVDFPGIILPPTEWHIEVAS
jgi:lipopolysaccharide transport system ATP-binding protein